jgi:hypothetical protein
MRALTRGLLGIALVAGSLAASGAPALAECVNQENRWPAFDQVVRTAQQVFVARVTKTHRGDDPADTSPVFTIEFEDVLRGAPPESLEIENLRSGLPLRGKRSCIRDATLRATPGDRIVFAIDGKVPGVKGRVTTAAWLEGQPSNDLINPGLLRIDLNDALRLMEDQTPLRSVRAILSGSSVSIEGETLTILGVPAVPWIEDWPSTSFGQWDLSAFADAWDARSGGLGPGTAVLRLPELAEDIVLQVIDIEADGQSLRMRIAALQDASLEGTFGPASLFIEIDAGRRGW